MSDFTIRTSTTPPATVKVQLDPSQSVAEAVAAADAAAASEAAAAASETAAAGSASAASASASAAAGSASAAATSADDAAASAAAAEATLASSLKIDQNLADLGDAAIARTNLGTDASNVPFTQSGTGAVTRTVAEKLNETVSVLDFGAVGDGVANDAAAINLALATGKDVYLPQGFTFLVNGTPLEPVGNQRIYGGGRLLNTTDTIPHQIIKIEGVDNVTIDGLWLDCTRGEAGRCYGITTQDAENTTIQNCRSTVATFLFIWRLSKNTKVLNNTTSAGQFAVATGGDALGNTDGLVEDTLISGNYFTGASTEAIDINWDTQRCIITDNMLVGNSIADFEEQIDVGGGDVNGCRDIVISNNTIDGAGIATGAILIKQNAVVPTRYVTISGNTMRGFDGTVAGKMAVRITRSEYVTMTGNTIVGAYRGIVVDTDALFVTVQGNIINATETDAIKVVTATARNVAIIDNQIYRSGQLTSAAGADRSGITVADAVGVEIRGNSLRECGLSAPTGGGGYGNAILLLSSATRPVVIGNTVIQAGSNGINCVAVEAIIQGNYVKLCGSGGILVSATHANCQGNTVSDNSVIATDAYGIQVAAGADFSIICGNKIFDTRGTKLQNGLRFVGAADRLIVNNNISYNNLTTNITGQGSLTNSLVGAAGNIVS